MFEAELRNLECKLNKLAQNVAKEGSLNTGGKFEWIDSVLVKCLQDGSWLLVDNVNLCSSAVLDRLNALLEPGGSLTIGERGVGPNGEVVTICPHPGFRLFLTMDPHNGEISRAMRNRGIEICLLSPQEEEYNCLDMRSLLYHFGLKSETRQDMLLSVHHVMNMEQGLGEPSLPRLLHAALLISQQISLGQGQYEAFLSSCCDVYVKSRVRSSSGSVGFPDFKQKLYQLLTEILENSSQTQKTHRDSSEDKFAMDVFTLTTPKIKENTSFTVMKQQVSLLKVLLEAAVSSISGRSEELMKTGDVKPFPNTENLNRLLDVHNESIIGTKAVTDVIPSFLLMFYQTAAQNDIELRHEWLAEFIAKCKRKCQDTSVRIILEKYQKVSEILKNTLCQAISSPLSLHENLVKCVCCMNDLPWDIRWLPNIAAFCDPKCFACRTANKLALLLCFMAKKIQTERMTEEMHSGKRKSLTVMEYSTALMQGTLTDNITSHCVVTKFVPLIHQFDVCLEAALKSLKTSLDLDQFRGLYEALGWRFRFFELGHLQLVSSEKKKGGKRTGQLIEEAMSTLSVHYNWLLKWTVPKLQLLVESDEALKNSRLVSQLESTLKVIDSSLEVSSSVLLQVGKKTKQDMCQPVPHSSDQQVELWEQIQRLSDLLCVWPNTNYVHRAKSAALISFLRTQIGMKARLDIVLAYQHLVHGDNIDQVICIITEVEKSCQASGLIQCSLDSISEDEDCLNGNSEVQLWPVQELMCVILSGALKRALTNSTTTRQQIGTSDEYTVSTLPCISSEDIAKNLSSIMLSLPTIPPIMASMIKFLSESNKVLMDCTSDGFKNLIPKLMMVILQHTRLSPAVRQVKDWLSWKPKSSSVENGENEVRMECIGAEDTRKDSFPLHSPLMTHIVTSFILPSYQSCNTNATLGSHKTCTLQLSILKEILWRNMRTLSSPELNYKLNDAFSVESFFKRFLHTLSLALGNNAAEVPDQNCFAYVEGIVQTLKDYNKHDRRQQTVSRSEENINEIKQFSGTLIQLTETVTRLRDSIRTVTNPEAEMSSKDVGDLQILVSTAEAWTLLGFLQVTLYLKLGLMDPIAKKKLKLHYVSEDLEETEKMLYAQELQSRVCSASLDKFDECNIHPHIVLLRERLKHLIVRQNELKKCVAARPDPPLFDSLAKETLHYSRSLASGEVVLSFHKRIVNEIQKLDTKSFSDKEKMVVINRAEEILREEQIWQESQLQFCDKMNSIFCSWYPDLVIPILSAATQLCYGLHQLATILQKKVILTKMSLGYVRSEQLDLNKLLRDLIRFPSLGEGQASFLSLVDTCTSDITVSVLKKVLADETEGEKFRKETYQLYKSSLEELKNLVMIRGELNYEIWMKMTQLLSQMVAVWRQQEDARKQKQKEDESFYVTKCKTLSDEDRDALELEEIFPSSSTSDFGDLQQQATLDQIPVAKKDQNVSLVDGVTAEDVVCICQIHSHVMQSYTSCAWLSPTLALNKFSHLRPDFITPLLQRYQLFSLLLEKLSGGLDSSLDTSLYPSLSLLTSVALTYIDKGRTKFSDVGDLSVSGSPSRQKKFLAAAPKIKVFDFYRDGFVKEVKQCFPVLITLTKRVKELLAEWSDHPTLKQMLVIIDRILNFPLTSPVSRFLAGFEILLDKMHEWEENAYSGVSLAAHWKSVTDQIGSWRKLELQCWKDYLDNAASRIEAAASKWWFYIYSLVESFTRENGTEAPADSSSEELIKTFQKFMEQSTLGEYEARLNILFTFHCHVVHMQQTVCRDKVMNILWNVYHYYYQFSAAVAARIRDLRSPIEKKLKDCVKIFRWDDISHWAIKEAIKKVHKTLHKHIKEFREILNQPVIESLKNPTSETGDVNLGMWDRPQRHQPRTYQSLFEPLHFISDKRLKKLTVKWDDNMEGPLLSRSGSLFMKARKLCREIILSTPYAKSVQTVEGLITEVIETSSHLKNLEISDDLPKSKQKSQAKNFLQQKRKALADLFRTLQQMGLSYRTGLMYWNTGEVGTYEFNLPPIDLRASFHHLRNKRIDGLLLSLWDGSETYFVRSIARLALLNTSLQNSAKDLGPSDIERCRGFAIHLMVLSREQKLLLSESSQLLCSLRSQSAQLAAMEETSVMFLRQSQLQSWLVRLKDLLVTCVICLEQFRIFLYCCPSGDEQNMNSSVEIPILEFIGDLEFPPIVKATKGDLTWNAAVEKVKSLVTSASKLKYTIEKSEPIPASLYDTKVGDASSTPSRMLISCAQYEALVSGYKQVEEFVKDIDVLKSVFELPSKPQECKERQETEPRVTEEGRPKRHLNPMIDSLIWLQQYMLDEAQKFLTCVKENGSASEYEISTTSELISCTSPRNAKQESIVKDFREDTERFLKTVLVIIQEVYKKLSKKSDEPDEDMENDARQSMAAENTKEEGSEIRDGHLKIVESLSTTLSMLRMTQINEELNGLLQRLIRIMDSGSIQEGNICKRLLLLCLPCLDQLVLFYQFFVTQQVASYRVCCKLLSVLLAIFLELVQKGFCIPSELAANEEGSQKDNPAGGLGLGEGVGEKDISEQIDSEEQLEDARPKGEEKEEDDKDCKEEESGIEMSQDFDGKVQDLEKKADEEDESDSDKDNEEEPDKEMGETDAGADRLDQQIWGSDSEDEVEENNEAEKGTGEKIGDQELGANDENNKPGEESDGEESGKQELKRKEINEMDDPDENDDQIDPYHGKHEPLPEPEPLDLPEDLQLDDDEKKEGGNEDGEEENPFDIDKMKEQKESEEQENEEKELSEESEQINTINEEMEESREKESEQEEIEGGGSKDEEKAGDEPKIEPEKEVEEETAKPSEDQSADIPAEAAAEMDWMCGSKDQVVSDIKKDKSEMGQQHPEDNIAEENDEKQGVGQAQSEKTDTGHYGDMATPKDNVQTGNSQKDENVKRRQRLRESDDNRSLAEVTEPVKKKLRTINIEEEDDREDQDGDKCKEESAEQAETADMYQHIKEAKKTFDAEILDAATKEQAEKQSIPNLEDEDGEEAKEDDNMDFQEDLVSDEEEIPTKSSEKISGDKKHSESKDEKKSGTNVDDGGDVEMSVEVEGDKVETLGAARGSETTFHTMFGDITTDTSQYELMSPEDYNTLRSQLESQIATWSQPPPNEEAEKAWELFSAVTSGLARDLSEQLRLVLEPTQASRLRGDYRTGRRINMRKVIPYIASQFRKDKIWLRRTKPSKREYQIVLAIDDSSSMADNRSKQLAFESLSLVSRALTLLEAGELAVISFGEMPKVLHQLGHPFTERNGARLLQQFSFDQNNTRVGQLVDFVTTMFTASHRRSSSNNERAQLLVIVSDGRVVSEGPDRVKQAVRRAKQNGIFMVFVIVDNPESKDSVLDIQQPIFSGSKCVGFSSYLDNFPFPFYLILRDINALPTVLSDALRQWFELITNMDK